MIPGGMLAILLLVSVKTPAACVLGVETEDCGVGDAKTVGEHIVVAIKP